MADADWRGVGREGAKGRNLRRIGELTEGSEQWKTKEGKGKGKRKTKRKELKESVYRYLYLGLEWSHSVSSFEDLPRCSCACSRPERGFVLLWV